FATIPVNNREFWKSKIDGNVERDKINIAKLQELGWRVIEIWQCELKPKNKDLTLQKLLTELRYEQR
ncbi:MAG: very short patch repair endonuclease, partial [Lachnospiraceae bacterium]|nr:very short patch repair endonuclease [Lachnospiraceae bacterium]